MSEIIHIGKEEAASKKAAHPWLVAIVGKVRVGVNESVVGGDDAGVRGRALPVRLGRVFDDVDGHRQGKARQAAAQLRHWHAAVVTEELARPKPTNEPIGA